MNAQERIRELEQTLATERAAIEAAAKAMERERTFHPNLWAWPARECPQCHALQILDAALASSPEEAT